MNERQSAYRSAEGITRVLESYGRDCPKCATTGYVYIGCPGRTSIDFCPRFPSTCTTSCRKPIREAQVCDRCRGFGRILNLTQDQFINFAHYTYTLRSIIAETNCPA